MWVGLDLGTSGLKAVVIDESGGITARSHQTYPTYRPESGASEQDPADWLIATAAAIRSLAHDCDASQWQGIGLSGMLPTLVILDDSGNPVGHAITWEDSRATEQGDALRVAYGGEKLYSITGQWVDGRYLLPMFARRLEVRPTLRTIDLTLVGAKDFLFTWLTGELLTDPSTAAGYGNFNIAANEWDPRILSAATALSGVKPRLPDIASAATSRILTQQRASELALPARIPVTLGVADSVAGALGLGVSEPGQVAYVAGTSTIILGVADQVPHDDEHRFLVTPLAHPAYVGVEMDLLATGSAIRWLTAILGLNDEATLLALAASVESVGVPQFLPYLAPGEQGALWDPLLTGTLTGLDLSHGPGHIARSLIDGILLESRRCIGVLDNHGFPPGPLIAAGGSAVDPWFRQQLADATGREVHAAGADDPDRSAVGAAYLAAGFDAPRSSRSQTLPSADAKSHWHTLAQRHDLALAALRSRHDSDKALDARRTVWCDA